MNRKPDIVSVIGARPQYIKAAIVSKALAGKGLGEFVINTGQHYDDNMSDIFVRELGMRVPDIDLGIGSGTHGQQTARGLEGIEEVLLQRKPGLVLVYGDTNATLSGCLAAVKLKIPVAHVEAGLRSYNRTMPEEINRVVADHVSDIRFCPTDVARKNLEKEGITGNVVITGDVMIDMVHTFLPVAEKESNILETFSLEKKKYVLLTLHRPANSEDKNALTTILEELNQAGFPVLFPVHPRVKKVVDELVPYLPNIKVTEPLGYIDMLRALSNTRVLVTDSGGLQKEAFTLKIPCLTYRTETEWVETVEQGWNVLVRNDRKAVPALIKEYPVPESWNPVYGTGNASENISSFLFNFLNN